LKVIGSTHCRLRSCKVETCIACELSHPEVDSKGFWYCPNPLCPGVGAAWFRYMLDSYGSDGDGQHNIDLKEWVEKGLEHLQEAEPTIKEAGERSAALLIERNTQPETKSMDAERLDTARDRVLDFMGDGQWHKAHEITDPGVGGSEGLRRLRELRADGYKVYKRKHTEGTWEYSIETPGEEDAYVTGRPTNEQAAALAALTLEVLTQKPQKLVWRVDLRRDVGKPDAIGDLDGYADGRWTATLDRLRAALDEQTGDYATTPFGLIVVLPLPPKQSSTNPPFGVTSFISQRSSATGFTVGWKFLTSSAVLPAPARGLCVPALPSSRSTASAPDRGVKCSHPSSRSDLLAFGQ